MLWQNGRRLPHDIFKRRSWKTMRLIFWCELHWNSFKLQYVNIGLDNGMAPVYRHICVTGPQWINEVAEIANKKYVFYFIAKH